MMSDADIEIKVRTKVSTKAEVKAKRPRSSLLMSILLPRSSSIIESRRTNWWTPDRRLKSLVTADMTKSKIEISWSQRYHHPRRHRQRWIVASTRKLVRGISSVSASSDADRQVVKVSWWTTQPTASPPIASRIRRSIFRRRRILVD